MTTAYSSNLGLALPVQGELSGTWGDTVNNGITAYTDISIAGTLTLTGDGAVTLTKTNGDATATNIGNTTAQYAVIVVTGTLTTTKIITAPASSKTYVVVNAATGGSVTVKAAGQPGVTVAAGETAYVAFTGTDFSLIAGTQQYPGAGIAVSTGSAWGSPLTAPAGALVGTTDTQTLTNKRVTARVVTVADAATITPTGDTADEYTVTALAQAATIATPSGTPTNGQKLILRIKDNGVARALTWTTTPGAYRAVGVLLPTTTTANKVTYVGCIYNTQDAYWDVVAVATQL